jgi:hypothetical protein
MAANRQLTGHSGHATILSDSPAFRELGLHAQPAYGPKGLGGDETNSDFATTRFGPWVSTKKSIVAVRHHAA